MNKLVVIATGLGVVALVGAGIAVNTAALSAVPLGEIGQAPQLILPTNSPTPNATPTPTPTPDATMPPGGDDQAGDPGSGSNSGSDSSGSGSDDDSSGDDHGSGGHGSDD